MKPRSQSSVPARLARGRERFDKFRKNHKGYHRLPDSLRSAAVKLAQAHGVNRTARVLRLDYSTLKKQLESTVLDPPPNAPLGSGFIVLLPSAVTAAAECVLEYEDAKGGRSFGFISKGRTLPEPIKIILDNSLTHGRRRFVEVAAHFPDECLDVLKILTPSIRMTPKPVSRD